MIEQYRGVRNTVDIVILTTADKKANNERTVPEKGIQILLVKRDIEPFKGMWTIPGGFVAYNKPLHQVVNEKLLQKTGIDNMYTEQLYTYGEDINRDPRDRVISIGYIALTTKDNLKIVNAHGEKETAWFWALTQRDENSVITDLQFIRDTQSNDLASDYAASDYVVDELGFDHKKIVIDAINRLANKLMYTDIGFNLVNPEFTVKQLQNSYEAILGKSIPAFRRTILPKLEATGLSTKAVMDKPDLHRPAQYFRKRQ